MKKRLLAWLLAAVMVFSVLPVSAFAEEGDTPTEATEAAAPTETEAPKETEVIPETTQAATESAQTTEATEPAATTEATEETAPTEAAEPETKPEERLVTAWAWNDEWETLSYDDTLHIWVMPLIGASEDMPAMWEDVLMLLPESITAAIGEETVELLLTWQCNDSPKETGAYTGSYEFAAAVPEGYALEDSVPRPGSDCGTGWSRASGRERRRPDHRRRFLGNRLYL